MIKTPIVAALFLLSSAAMAVAETGPANSTNQHQRDSASFYDSVPDTRLFTGARTDGAAERDAPERRATAR